MVETVKDNVHQDTNDANVRAVKWTLDGDDSGKAVDFAKHSDKTVHVHDTYGGTGWGGATVKLYGSNDTARVQADRTAGTLFASATADWVQLTDPQGDPVEFTVNGMMLIAENPLHILPVATGGTNSQIDVDLCGNKYL
jgi:hypothetical protein